MLYIILKHTHSGIRWIVLILLVIAIVNSIYKSGKVFQPIDRILNSAALYFLHLQVLTGLFLYFISPKVVFSTESMSDNIHRFFLVEHISLMIIAVIVATVGNRLSKKAETEFKKHRRISFFYGIALLMIFIAIPWPWQVFASSWF